MPGQLPLLTLVVHVPGAEDRRIDISEWRTVIGRSSRNDVQIVARQISKVHAAVELSDGVPYIRDLESRNGVEVNGERVHGSRALRPGDLIALGDALLTVDPNSVIFQPSSSQLALRSLLELEEEERRRRRRERRATQSAIEITVNDNDEPTRQATVIVGRTLGGSSGGPAILRILRIAGEGGPRDCARVEPFAMQTVTGARLWVIPQREVQVVDIGLFRPAPDIWIDEPEDFQSGPRRAQILARRMYHLPAQLKVVNIAQAGAAADGLPIFSEAALDEPMLFGAL